jgi:hypothetical protein
MFKCRCCDWKDDSIIENKIGLCPDCQISERKDQNNIEQEIEQVANEFGLFATIKVTAYVERILLVLLLRELREIKEILLDIRRK